MSILKIYIGVLLNFQIVYVSTSTDQQICKIIGSTVQLPCAEEANSTQWIKDKLTISDDENINRDVTDRHRFSILFQNISNEFILQIHNTTMSDKGQYSCDGVRTGRYIPFTKITYLCVIRIVVSPSTVVSEGTDVIISCFHECPQECNNISLDKDGVQLSRSKILKLQNVSQSSSGNYVCSDDSDRKFTSNKTITVQYPSEVQIFFNDSTSLLTCDVTGHPEPNVYVEHLSTYRELVRIINTTETRIFLKTFEDSGIYRCYAQNGVLLKDGLVNFSESLYIEIEGPPICVSISSYTLYGQQNKNITMAINIYCQPSCKKIYWITNNIGNSSAKQKAFSENGDSVFFMTFHDVSVKVNGSLTSLVLTHLTVEDFRTYTVVAENSVNTSYCSIHLKEKAADNQNHAIAWYILICLVMSVWMLVLRFLYTYLEEKRCFHGKKHKTVVVKTIKRQSRHSNRRNDSDSVFMEVIFNPMAEDRLFTVKNDSED